MASGNMKDIKRRIKSVQSTMQITKAMELVASSKMRRAKERALAARPYFNTMYETITRLAAETRDGDSVYTRRRPVKNSLYIVIAGDRGLAGGYNANLFKLAAAEMEGKKAQIVTIGKKAQEYYAKRDWPVAADYPGIAETMKISDTHAIVERMLGPVPRRAGGRGVPVLHPLCLALAAGAALHPAAARAFEPGKRLRSRRARMC